MTLQIGKNSFTANYSKSVQECMRCMMSESQHLVTILQVGLTKACFLLVLYALFVILVLAADILHRIR